MFENFLTCRSSVLLSICCFITVVSSLSLISCWVLVWWGRSNERSHWTLRVVSSRVCTVWKLSNLFDFPEQCQGPFILRWIFSELLSEQIPESLVRHLLYLLLNAAYWVTEKSYKKLESNKTPVGREVHLFKLEIVINGYFVSKCHLRHAVGSLHDFLQRNETGRRSGDERQRWRSCPLPANIWNQFNIETKKLVYSSYRFGVLSGVRDAEAEFVPASLYKQMLINPIRKIWSLCKPSLTVSRRCNWRCGFFIWWW